MKLKAVQSTETLQIDTSDYNTKFLIYHEVIQARNTEKRINREFDEIK